MCPPCLHKDSLKPAQRPTLNLHSVARSQVRPWFVGKTGRHDSLYRINLGFIHWHRQTTVPNDSNNPGGRKNWESIVKIEPAKHVARKQWGFDQLDSVRPEFAATAKWKEWVVTSVSKRTRNAEFMLRVDLQREPRELSERGRSLFATQRWHLGSIYDML